MAKWTEFMSNLFKKQKRIEKDDETMFFDELTLSYIEGNKNTVRVIKNVMINVNPTKEGTMFGIACRDNLSERESMLICEMVRDALS